MKKLLAKIRKILRDRRTRRFLTRFVSGVAALVVFVTTYALVLPAITMEKEANCGIEAHQHDDSCYTEELICDVPESDGHHHDESCYSTTSALVCETEEHEHSAENGCYDDEGNLICEVMEHRHNEECYEEVRELTCQIPESEGHHHTEDCYEKVLTCGKEVHVHSTACYEDDPVSDAAVAASTSSAAAATTSAGSVSSAGMTLNFEGDIEKIIDADEPVDDDSVDNIGSDETNRSSETNGTSEIASSSETNTEAASDTEVTYGRENAGTGRTETSNSALTNADNSATALTSSADANQYIPQLDAVDFNTVLNNHTGIYYYRAADEDIVEDSSAIPAEDWDRIPNNIDRINDDVDDVELGNKDLLRVYLSYTIPAGSLNATNPVARYRLPSNLHLTDPQVKAINENVNGLAGQYVDMSTLEITDPDKYNAYLGVEAVEGTRRPDEAVEDYLAEQAVKTGTDAADAAEYISAVVRVENVYDADGLYGEKDAYLGQDLIFTFAPYSIEKNQHEYDLTGKPTKAGEEIKGWFTFDLNMGQVDFEEPKITTSTVESSGIGDKADGDSKLDIETHIEDASIEDSYTEDDNTEDKHDVVYNTKDNQTENELNADNQLNYDYVEDEPAEKDNSEDDNTIENEDGVQGRPVEETESSQDNVVTIERTKRTAEIVFVEEGWDEKGNKIDRISTSLSVVEEVVAQTQDDNAEADTSETVPEGAVEPSYSDMNGASAEDDNAAKTDAMTDDEDSLDIAETDQIIMPAMSFDDSIKVSTIKPSGLGNENSGGTVANAANTLPKKAEVSVRVEADEGTFPVGTTMKLTAVQKSDIDSLAEKLSETVENGDASLSVDREDSQSEQNNNKSNSGTEEKKNLKTYGFQAVNITFIDAEGNEVEPAKPVRVALISETVKQVKKESEGTAVAEPVIVHVDDDGNAEQLELVAPEEIEPAQGRTEEELLTETSENVEDEQKGEKVNTDYNDNDEGVGSKTGNSTTKGTETKEDDEDDNSGTNVAETTKAATTESTESNIEGGTGPLRDVIDGEMNENGETAASTASAISFFTDSFSVYAIVYTVDFHYNVDGQVYDYSIMGGDTISLKELLPILKVVTDNRSTELNEVETFINDIDTVRFSDESLVKVTKIEEDTTVGELKEKIKEQTGKEPEYSGNLTDEDLVQIDAKELKAVDWALMGMKAFRSEETLTVVMKSGEMFTIVVTDAQDPNSLDGRTFSIVAQNNGKYSVTINSEGNGVQSKSTTIKDGGGNTISDIYNTTQTTLYSDTNDTAWMFKYDKSSGGYYLINNGRYLVFSSNGLSVVTEADIASVASLKQPVFITKNRPVTEEAVTDEENNTTYTYTYGDWDGTYLISNKTPLAVDNETTGHQSAPEGLKYLQAGSGSFTLTGNISSAAKTKLALPEDPTSTSHKASMISATSIQSGQRIVIYQRVLQKNDTYRTYAINGNGNMVEVFENSDSVYWVEDEPSIIWTITESSTGYYTLRNEKTGLYLTPKDAPGAAESQSVHNQSDFDDGDAKHLNISLPGAAGGQYTSTISCWDYDANVTYGLAVSGGSDQNAAGTAIPATLTVPELTESQAFYFAVCDPIILEQLTTVDTVDSRSMGIKISMYDFHDTRIINYARQRYMTEIMWNDGWSQGSYTPGFLSRTLGEDGYPVVVKNNGQNLPSNQQRSLKDLFEYQSNSDNPKTTVVNDVNHLFLQSVYDESGFFKYSCFENFAQLNYNTPNEDGSIDFTVYEQVGVPWREKNPNNANDGNWEGRHDYYERGNFMPFDELTTANGHRSVNKDEDLNDLLDTDARKGEPLYYIKNVDNGNYYFGMIMEGSFTQKPGGLSDRGDPMVYEFNGDDDMWVYLDGILVLDIGGVHDAFRGSINFRTGKVEVIGPQKTQGGSGREGETTWIKDQYYRAGKLPDGSDWPTQNGQKKLYDPKIDAFFTNDGIQDGKLVGTFKDYSTHDFKMFYMERGAGASNLELQFNLTLAPEAGFRVKKELPYTIHDKTVQTQYADAPFYYQAYIRDKGKDSDNYHLYIPYEDTNGSTNGIVNEPPYTDSPPYYETIVQKDDGSLETQKTDIVWADKAKGIFVVKPGQTAFFPVREKGVEWYVKEVPAPGYQAMLNNFEVINTDPSYYDPPYSEDEEHRVSQNGTVTKSRSVTERGVVVFNNYPDESLVKELQITKRLKGSMFKDPRTASGLVEAVETNSPYFEYKVFLESTDGTIVPYALGPYYQKDKDGNYIYYEKGQRKNPETGSFEIQVSSDETSVFAYKYVYQTRDSSKVMGWFGPIQHKDGTISYEGYRVEDGPGYIEYTYEPKATEYTSINGSLGDVRDGDTVIIKGLMIGTTFVVDERTDRSNMIKGTPGEDTDKKYLFEGTEVTGAFTGQTDDEELQERIEASGTLYTNDPVDREDVSYSNNAGKGVIIPNENAHVLVKNQGEPPFSLDLQKKWSEDYDLTALDKNAKVVFTLKRLKLKNKSGAFTLKANVIGQPNYDPVYLIKDGEGNVIRTITFSSMDTNQSFDEQTKTAHREKVLRLPIGGPYYVEYGTGTTEDNTPYGYDVTNSPVVYGTGEATYQNILVTLNEQEEGEPMPDPEGNATPDEATVSSTFIMHTGSLIIQKTLTGDATLYGNFKAKYSITGNNLENPIEILTPTINSENWHNGQWVQWVHRVDDLLPGRYTVTEQILEDGPGLSEHKPSKRAVTVTKDGEATAVFEGEYKSNKIPVTVYSGNPNGTIRHTYKSVSGFEPGSKINISLRADYHQGNNNYYYETSSGDHGTFYGGTSPYPTISNLSLPASGELIIWIYHSNNSSYIPTVADTNFKEVTSTNSTQRRSMFSRGLGSGEQNRQEDQNDQDEQPVVNIGTETNPILNTVTPLTYSPDTQYVVSDDAWFLEVALTNSVEDSGKTTNHVITVSGSVGDTTVSADLPDSFVVDLNNQTWTATIDAQSLETLNLPALEESDEDGNLYYYYIYAVREENVPAGTSVSFDKDGNKTLYASVDNNSTPLSITNTLAPLTVDITIKKARYHDNGTDLLPLGGVTFQLLEDRQGFPSGDGTFTISETQKDTGIVFEGLTIGNQYTLKEVIAPDGYNKMVGDIEFTVEDTGISLSTESEYVILDENDALTIIVINEPGAALPNTGGHGTKLIYLTGILFTALSILLFCKERKGV